MNIHYNNAKQAVSIKYRKANCIIKINSPQNVMTRPMTQCKEIQDIRMMFFQQLVMKQARAALRSKSFQVFSQQMSIEVELSSMIPPSSIKLEMLLKVILDGLNGNVIKDDSLVMNANISHIKSLIRYPKPIIKVEVINLVTKDALNFTLELPTVEKAVALPFDIDGVMTYDTSYKATIASIEAQLSSLLSSSTNRFNECHIVIKTSNSSTDVDNLALLYLETLRKHNVLDSNRIGVVGMYKRLTTLEEEGVVINLFHEV
ncbi:RusA family crossover junction endodeoxyribonuclease [Bacillus sp. FJAT-22090]|uniref:RusA family crossover junction endodeoxyribonuclease n=1 Tax=Bacillus sp. FJAT-22090 TaxID=1581038 RepID=UPI0011A3B8B8|nr:RusA family crossover junction endodeoxyribonuclease [Bacillus sp. FJAT-22090]